MSEKSLVGLLTLVVALLFYMVGASSTIYGWIVFAGILILLF